MSEHHRDLLQVLDLLDPVLAHFGDPRLQDRRNELGREFAAKAGESAVAVQELIVRYAQVRGALEVFLRASTIGEIPAARAVAQAVLDLHNAADQAKAGL